MGLLLKYSVADPGSLFVLDPDSFPSQIPDPATTEKRRKKFN
jgi:hypothetical protein